MGVEAGGFNLGNAYGSVVIDVSGVSSAMQQARQAIDRGIGSIGGAISSVGDTMSNLGKSISTFSGPLLAVGVVGVKSAADFDTLMKQIEIFGNVAPDQLETVSQFALKMGADTKFSSADAASALLELLKSGQSLEQAMKTLPDVLSLAATGNLDLATASGIVSSGLSIYKLKAEESGRVSNALARAANATRADVGDLGQALANAGPVAAQFGLSIEDTSAILGIFANNGIMGGEAGTALKSVLLNLNRPTKDVKDALKLLNVNLYDGQGNTRDFNTIIKELDKSLSKMPVEQQNELMQTLGGSFGVVGLSALRAAGGLDAVKQQMDDAPDAANVAASFMDTFKGNVESLTGSFETLMISALTPFMNDVLQPMVKQITEVINSVIAWTQQNPELTKQIMEVLAVVAVLGPALVIAGSALSAIGGILTVLLSPIGLVVAAVAALAAAYFTNFAGVRDFVDTQVRPVLERVFNWLGTVWETTIKPGMEALRVWFVETAFPAIGKAVEDFRTNIFEPVAKFIGEAWTNTISPGLESLRKWFVDDALPAIGAAFNDFRTNIFEPVVNFIGDIWTIVSKGLGDFFNWMAAPGGGLDQIKKGLNDFKTNVIEPVVKAIQDIWTKVQPFLESLKSGMKGVFDWIYTNVIKPAMDFVTDLVNKIHELAGQSTTSSSTMMQQGMPANMQTGMQMRDSGGPGVAGMAYQIGNRQLQNEVYIPGADGQFVSGFVDLMKAVASGVTGGSSGGDTINVVMPESALANPAGAYSAGQDFGRGIMDEMRSRGLKGVR